MAAEQWPVDLEDVKRVVDHWVRGCGADACTTLFQMQHGLNQTYANGFWCSDEVPHGVPVEHVPSHAHRYIDPAALVRLGLYLTLHDPALFVAHAHFIESMKGKSQYILSVHKIIVAHTCTPLLFEVVMRDVKQPSINRMLWNVVSTVLARHDAAAVCARVAETLSHPIPVRSAGNHAYVERYVRDLGLSVFPTHPRQIGVLQYPSASATMSHTDHTLFIVMGAFADDSPDAPANVLELRAWLASHERDHTLTVVQEIMREWRQARIRQ